METKISLNRAVLICPVLESPNLNLYPIGLQVTGDIGTGRYQQVKPQSHGQSISVYMPSDFEGRSRIPQLPLKLLPRF